MKKIFVLLMLMLTACSSAFAEFELDVTRWKFYSITERYEAFFDTQSIRIKNPSEFAVWECNVFYNDNKPCGFNVCKRKGIDKGKHFHYVFCEYDYNANTSCSKSLVIRDNNGTTIDSTVFSDPKPSPVMPESVGETAMLKIKKYVDSLQNKTQPNVEEKQ